MTEETELKFVFFFDSTRVEGWLVKRFLKHHSWEVTRSATVTDAQEKRKRSEGVQDDHQILTSVKLAWVKMLPSVLMCLNVHHSHTWPNNCELISHFCVPTKMLALSSPCICPSCWSTHIARQVYINTDTYKKLIQLTTIRISITFKIKCYLNWVLIIPPHLL